MALDLVRASQEPLPIQSQQVPGAGDTAVIGGTQETVVVATGNPSVDRLVLDNPNAILRVVGYTFDGHVQLTVGNGFENRGTIELANEGSANGTILKVTTGTLTNAVGGTLRVPTGTHTGFRRFEGDIDNRGTIEATAGFILLGNLANSGAIHVPEGQTFSFLPPGAIWRHQGGSITGTGTVQFPSGLELETDFVPGAYILDAMGLTVSGPGRLFAPATGELRMSHWIVHSDIVVSGDIRVEGGTSINGRLSVLAGKTLRVVETVTSGFARMTVAHGFENHGTVELASESGPGNRVELAVSSGVLTNVPGGVLRTTASGARGVFEADIDNRGTIQATAGLVLRGNLANSGTVHVPEAQALSFLQPGSIWRHQGGSVTGTGTVRFPPRSGSRLELETDFIPGLNATEAEGLTVSGPGKLLGPATGELRMNAWNVEADLVVSGDMRVEGGTRINGRLSVLAGKTLRFVETLTSGVPRMSVAHGFENHGTIELASESGPGNTVVVTVASGVLTNAPGGVLRTTASGDRGIFEADIDNRGTMQAAEGFVLRGSLLNASSGVLTGGGTFDLTGATVTQEGILAPGDSPGFMTIRGRLPHGEGSRFEAEIGGFTPGSQHDRLILENPATLGGAIRPVLLGGFLPKKDDAFTVLTYPSRTGAFASIDHSQPDRIAWDVRYGPTSAQLVVPTAKRWGACARAWLALEMRSTDPR